MVLWRRFLVLTVLLFWQGGFLFYSSVVVPLGREVLTPMRQATLTQTVTNYLNLAGALALVPLAWDVIASAALHRRWRWLMWLVLALGLPLLAWLHVELDRTFDVEAREIVDRQLFRWQHKAYLWVSTVQWAAGVAYMVLMLRAWREEDRKGTFV